ncbi:MAG: CDP-glycerol glycerophosphotransferase family protein [Actinomycetia bacterium]|nr:CDP-glycerol glycerophosphotransferase family protein [Actinomycetes bacterium]
MNTDRHLPKGIRHKNEYPDAFDGNIVEDIEESDDDPICDQQGRRRNRFRAFMPFFHNSKKRQTLGLTCLFITKTSYPVALEDMRIVINDQYFMPEILIGSKKGRYRHFCLLRLKLKMKDLQHMKIHNAMRAYIQVDEDTRIYRPITYNVVLRRYVAAHGHFLYDEKQDTTAFFRQSVGRGMLLTVRHRNQTDLLHRRLKLYLAWLLSVLMPFNRPILLFEKNASKYEESAKVVFERMVDMGQPRIHYVISKQMAERLDVADSYRRHFIYQHSFRHYLAFFRCRMFIGTESIAHCLELRVQNPFAQHKISRGKKGYVFLQHGVMMMISLDSPQRTSFRRDHMRGKVRVVVSSPREAQHFIDLAGFAPDELVVSGLPKFDFSYQYPDADKILVMPTWRFWEFNAIKYDTANAGYVRMIKRILEEVPEHLKDKVVVAPHPLFGKEVFQHATGEANGSYDELLRKTRLLITDYSSISFDAFYRGANVLFYWRELEECMSHYGEPTHLMLDEHSVFGDVCLDDAELGDAIERNYSQAQAEQYIERYRQLVVHHDGCNTERLVNRVQEDFAKFL